MESPAVRDLCSCRRFARRGIGSAALVVPLLLGLALASRAEPPEARTDEPCSGKLRLQTIRFDTSSDRIRIGDSVVLEEAGRILRTCPEIDVRIEGHTDARGSEAHNLDLSRRRAAAVKRYLVKLGIGAERLRAVGVGKQRPLKPGTGEAANRMNRRVTLDFVERPADEEKRSQP